MTITRPQIGLSFRVERGCWADYLALAQFHYRARRPATVRQVWRLTAEYGSRVSGLPRRSGLSRRSAAKPEAKRGLGSRQQMPACLYRDPRPESQDPPPPLLWRLGGYPRLAGVVVVSCPVLSAAARDRVTGSRYRTPGCPRVGIDRLNREALALSRVIVHPLYRGLGLAGRFVAAVLDRLDVPLVESFARMGEYVPFFRRAGMRELRLPGKPVYYYRFASKRPEGPRRPARADSSLHAPQCPPFPAPDPRRASRPIPLAVLPGASTQDPRPETRDPRPETHDPRT